jgi:hypothetical protein
MTEREAATLLLTAAQRGQFEASAIAYFAASFGLSTIDPGKPAPCLLCRLIGDGYPLIFLDNEVAACGDCGRQVQYRPDIPTDANTKFQCLFCAIKELGLVQ